MIKIVIADIVSLSRINSIRESVNSDGLISKVKFSIAVIGNAASDKFCYLSAGQRMT
jgi:hypothetical protein